MGKGSELAQACRKERERREKRRIKMGKGERTVF